MNKLASVLLTLVISIFVCQAATAQSGRCDAVLAAREYVKITDEELFLEAVAGFSKESSLKESAERLKIHLFDVIAADGNGWRNAKDRVEKGQTRFTSREHASSYLFEGPAAGAIEAWVKCMTDDTGPNFFAHVASNADPNKVAVTLYWARGPFDSTPLKFLTPPAELKITELLGSFTALFDRPSPEQGPKVIPFNGQYPVADKVPVGVSTTVVLWPKEMSKEPGDTQVDVRVAASRISSAGKCDARGSDGKNEYEITLFLDDKLAFGPKIYPVPHSGSVAVSNFSVSTRAKDKITVKLVVNEDNHGTIATYPGTAAQTLDLSKESPKLVSLPAWTRKRNSGRTCRATLDLVVSW